MQEGLLLPAGMLYSRLHADFPAGTAKGTDRFRLRQEKLIFSVSEIAQR